MKAKACSVSASSSKLLSYPWEKPYLLASENYIFRKSFGAIRYILETMADHGTRFEHECYDLSHLYNLAHFVDSGLVKPPFFIQIVFGVMGGVGADLENMNFMKATADRLFGRDMFQWSVLAAGRHQMAFITQAALMGGHVRVGLEDSLLLARASRSVERRTSV
jgi:uncharacterized protein (DUF849 family)